MGIDELIPIHDNLDALVGGGAAMAFGVALMASGFSSSSVGTYAGQVVMAGFMNWRLPLLLRRGLTMLPSLIILAISVNPGQALIYSQIVLSFGIPFALVPLFLITRNGKVMGGLVNKPVTNLLMMIVTAIITTLNLYLLFDTISGLF